MLQLAKTGIAVWPPISESPSCGRPTIYLTRYTIGVKLHEAEGHEPHGVNVHRVEYKCNMGIDITGREITVMNGLNKC